MLLAVTPRDQKIIDALRKASKWKDKRIADLEEDLEKLQMMEIDGKMIEREMTKKQKDILEDLKSVTCT